MSNKQTTIDDLAMMIKKGFDGVDQQFKGVDEKFKGVNGRLDGMEQRLDKVEHRLEDLENGQQRILIRLDNLVYKFELQALERRVKVLEQKAGVSG